MDHKRQRLDALEAFRDLPRNRDNQFENFSNSGGGACSSEIVISSSDVSLDLN